MDTLHLETIEFCTPSTVIAKNTIGHSGENYYCMIHTRLGTTPAMVKLTRFAIDIISELVVSLIGRAIGLPIPKPYLVQFDTHRIPKEMQTSYVGTHICFASSLIVGSQNLARQTNSQSPYIQHIIRRHRHLFNQTCAFDEWTCNPDRNLGNLLFDPSTESFWLIDHAQALSSYWNPNIEQTNVLLDSIQNSSPVTEKLDIALATQKLMHIAQDINFTDIDDNPCFDLIDYDANLIELRHYLAKRVQSTVTMICQKLAIPPPPPVQIKTIKPNGVIY